MSLPLERRSPREAGNEVVCLGGHHQSSTAAQISNTSTQAQRQRLLDHLQKGAIDTITARRDLNVMHPAMRIKELREAGHNIQTVRVEQHDDQGRKHRKVALYVLHGGAA
ncbi:helix-turn-helix domain-containing protein [Rhodanobacter aciditrophus]|uniref:helix-turn-helix domain-containing protein n=1 Tax=Rhodanobacter aciditrophus TaxID=1623218 RepID=UPI003CF5392F